MSAERSNAMHPFKANLIILGTALLLAALLILTA